jgi:putative transposase
VPEDLWPEFKARATAAYQAPSRKIARELAEGVVADHGAELANAVGCFMDDFEACIAHLRLPMTHRRATRTTNLLERLFVEERRRLKIIPNAFGEKAVLKLMFGAMTRAAERWRSIRITEFERRQMAQARARSRLRGRRRPRHRPLRGYPSRQNSQQISDLTQTDNRIQQSHH